MTYALFDKRRPEREDPTETENRLVVAREGGDRE